MKFRDAKVGMMVYDRWWPWCVGRITWVGKTRLKVWLNRYVTYDAAHCQFLEKV